MYTKRFARTFLIVQTICFLSFTSQAQVDPNLENLRTVIPPSPNTSSLGKFGEWPVSLYTGVPGINIPIYELKGRSLSVPVSLSYHSAGIRVGEVASWVGLGWALNAGGCISRTVQDLPDDDDYFVTTKDFTNKNNFCGGAINSNAQNQVTGLGASGSLDIQQDIYNLNVLGKSYRILLNADSTASTMPFSNIKITSTYMNDPSFATWRVILEDGTKLLFGGATTGTNPYVEVTTNIRLTEQPTFNSAWYLQSITSPTGEVITFTYTSSSVTQNTHFTQSDNLSYCTLCTVGANATAPFINSPAVSSHAETQTVTQLSLSTIESDLTRIYFIPSATPRSDLNGGVALSEIKVMSKYNGTYIGDWLFNYNYSRAATGNEMPATFGGSSGDTSFYHQRLKLMSINRKAMDNLPSQGWSFSYNPLSLPSTRSFAQDYWGFYNGATTNTSVMAKIAFDPSLCTAYNNYGYYAFTTEGWMDDIGQNLTPNENYMQAEMLKQVTYPTGGSTVFTYEANKQPANLEVFSDTTINNTMYVTYNQSPFVNSYSYAFTLTKPEYIYITLSSTISTSVMHDYPAAYVSGAILDSAGNIICNVNGNGASWFNLYRAGHYTFKLYTNVPANVFATSSYYITAGSTFRYFPSYGFQNVSQLLGGVRLKTMQEFDGVSATPVNSKYYVYDSAFVIYPVDTVNSYITTQTNIVGPNGQGLTYYYQKLTRNSSTKYALGTIQGGTVGYGKVTVYNGLNGADGYTVSRFSCDGATQASLPASLIFPYPPTDPLEWRNGLLTSERTYTASGVLMKKISNVYSFINESTYENIKEGYSTLNAPSTCVSSSYGACGITVDCYSITNEWMQHTTTTETDYNTATGDSISVTTSYYYDDNLNSQPVRTLTFNSKGDSVVGYNRTPLELTAINASIPLTGTATVAIDTMIARNIVSVPVESEKYTKSILTGKILVNYKLESNGYVQQDNVMAQNASNALETRVYFPRYNTKGNLLEQAKAYDENHDYIWDYQYTYPIAEVVNADSSSIAYTSFEADGTGNWTIASSARDSVASAITGYKSYNLSNGSISTAVALSSSRTYIVSYWSKSGSSYTVTSGGTPKQGKTIVVGTTSWTYFEHTITGVTSITISGSNNIDELRLYPSGAQMTTYTYLPLIGVSSQCDLNNRITYYQYDGFLRLYMIMDQDRNALKKFCYNYYGQSISCSQFYSAAKSGIYTRHCGVDSSGSTVTYSVPVNKYTSLVSQANADSLAQADVYNNGQAYANINGTCTFTGYPITAHNNTALSGFSVTYTNTSTSVQTTFPIPAAGGTIGTLMPATYNVSISKAGNTTVSYIYTVCTTTHAAAVTGNFSNMVINATCNSITIDTVN